MITIIISALKIIFLLGFLILIHEAGHLIVAKICKVKVNEFAIGFGPTIWKKQGKETKYALRLIPLGGFCSMEGEEERSENEGSFSKASIPKRIAIVIAGAIANLFGYLLNFLYNIFNNYGIAIIVFSVILRIILIPVTISQQKSIKKNEKMQEKMKEIQRKYKNNPEKLNQETMDLYKREKLNPFSGCLSSILQIIIILSVFWLVSKPLTYMKKVDTNIINGYVEEIKNEEGKASAYPEIQVIQKKASTDENVNINMEFFGLDLSKVPNQNMGDITVYIIPVLYIITSFISIKITNGKKKKNKTLQIEEKTSKDKVNVEDGKTENDESLEAMQEMNNSMMYMVPIMSISIAFIAPLGLALYWLVSNILIIIERLIIDKIFNKEEDKNA